MRVVLATLLAAGVAGLALLPEPGSFLPALLAMVLGFLLAAAKGAVDLVDLERAELAADALGLAVLGIALTRISTGNATLIGALIAVACAAQGIPLAATMARWPRRSTSPPMPPGSA
jgi:purine-cytosine permease-like protein